MRCKFCNRKVGESRVRGKLDYVTIHARDPNTGFFACLDCAKEIKASLSELDTMISPCVHDPESECYEPTSNRIRCQMLRQGWTGSPVLCHKSVDNGGVRTQ